MKSSRRNLKKHAQIFEHLPEPETRHVIILGRGHVVDIVDTGIRDRSGEVFLETLDSTGSIVEIFGVTSRTPCIKVGLEDLGT